MNGIDLSNALDAVLTGLGVAFLVANLWTVVKLLQFRRYCATALVTWSARKPQYYGIFLAFGEAMMLVYYGYLWPMSFRINRGL